MLKRSERKRLEAKVRDWDEGLRGFNIWWRKVKRECRICMNMIFNWYFFYQAKGKGDKALHIIAWLMVNLALLRIFRFI